MRANLFNSNVQQSLAIQSTAEAVRGKAIPMLDKSHGLLGIGLNLDSCDFAPAGPAR